MTNSRLHASVALGGVLIVGAFVAFLPPIPPLSAQGHAQRICREEGISPDSEVHEICLSQTIRGLEQGELRLARRYALVVADAQEACLRTGLRPQAESLRACTDRESYARGLLLPR